MTAADDDDRQARKDRRFTGFLWIGMGLLFASAMLSGLPATLCGIVGGLAVAASTAIAFGLDGHGHRRRHSAPCPKDEPLTTPEPRQSLSLHVDAPPAVQRWLDRVEQTANAARRSR